MTAVDPDAPMVSPDSDDVMQDPRPIGVCPYLAAADGEWRSASVARDHRCGAVAPPAPLAPEKQRRLCLTAAHVGCATYEAARAARPVAHDRAPTLARPLARVTPVVLDHGRLSFRMSGVRSDRPSTQAILMGMMGVAFAAIILARLTGGGASGGANSPSVTTQSSVQTGTDPSAPINVTPAPGASTAPSAGVGASAAPATPRPSTTGTQTYKVKSGDTLVGIAAKFGTTTKAIAKLNGITNPSSLKVGQVLQIP